MNDEPRQVLVNQRPPLPLGYLEVDRRTHGRRGRWIVVAYALLSVAWGFVWMPYGIGYYGPPWSSTAFRVSIQLVAWCHLCFGLVLGIRRYREGILSAAVLACIGVSIYCLIGMYDWIGRV